MQWPVLPLDWLAAAGHSSSQDSREQNKAVRHAVACTVLTRDKATLEVFCGEQEQQKYDLAEAAVAL